MGLAVKLAAKSQSCQLRSYQSGGHFWESLMPTLLECLHVNDDSDDNCHFTQQLIYIRHFKRFLV